MVFLSTGSVVPVMNGKEALRLAAYYRGLAYLSGLVGAVFVAAGILIGLEGNVQHLVDSPRAALGTMSLLPVAILGLLGVVIWQVGKTAAFYRTMTAAVDDQLATRFDSERVKSEILSVLDSRLAEMQTEIGNTRRAVHELEQEPPDDGFKFDD